MFGTRLSRVAAGAGSSDAAAGLQRARGPLRHGTPQVGATAADAGDHCARQGDRAVCHRHCQHSTGEEGQHPALFALLRDHRRLHLQRRDLTHQHIDLRAPHINPLRRRDTGFQHLFAPHKVCPGLRQLRRQRRVPGCHLGKPEVQFVVDDGGLPGADLIALCHRPSDQRPSEARRCRNAVAHLDGAIDRPPFDDRRRTHGDRNPRP